MFSAMPKGFRTNFSVDVPCVLVVGGSTVRSERHREALVVGGGPTRRRVARQPSGHVEKWHVRSDGGVTKRCAEVHVAGRAMGGGAGTLGDSGDQVASGVSPPAWPPKTTGVKRMPFC